VAAKPKDVNGIDFYYDSTTYSSTGMGQIWVKDGVSLYGGFNGTETLRTQRDPKVNVTSMLLQMRVRMLQDKPTVIDGFRFVNGIDMVVLIGDVGSLGTCQQLTISNNVFKNGGAPAGSIYGYGAPFRCNATIQGNTFSAGSNPIYIPSGAPTILGNFFNEGGGTSREGITVGSGGATAAGAVIANNIIWGMGVTVRSSGVLVANNSIVGGLSGPTLSNTFGVITNLGSTIVNNIIAFYGNGLFAFDFITAHHNLVFGNGANYVGLVSPGAGDMQRDPLLVDRANGNLHLTGSSPAINAGDTSVVQAWTDADGNARVFPSGGLVDMGAYEYGSSSAPTAPSNLPPVVNTPTASPSTVTGQTTQLSVVATDPDNDALTYRWMLSGSAPAAVSFSNAAAATTTVTFSSAGSYTFQVVVDDGHGHSVTSAPVTVVVTIPVVANQPPQVISLSATPNPVTGQTTQLSVVATDPDNDALTYLWTLSPGAPAAVSYSNAAAATTAVTFSTSGSYTFQVTINDGHAHSVTSAPVTVTVAPPPTVAPPAPDITTGLVGYWKFDQASGLTAADSAGTNAGTLNGGSGWTAGRFAGAVSLNGTTGFVNVNDNAPLNPTRITMAAWIQPQASGVGMVVSKSDGLQYWLRYETTTISMRVNVNGTAMLFTKQYSFAPGSWYHVAGTYDGANMVIYVNGSAIGSFAISGQATTLNGPLNIGRRGPSNINYFPGVIDDARIYNRALSASDIAALYNSIP